MDPSQFPPGIDLAQIPAGRPPRGVISNFVNPVTLKTPVVAINVVFIVLATAVVSLRVYTRKFINRALGPDDCKWLGLSRRYSKSDILQSRGGVVWLVIIYQGSKKKQVS